MHQRIAIITGSSSGIGKAFLELLAGDKGEFYKTPFDEIWAVGRRKDALDAIASSVSSVKVVPIAADLSDDSGIRTIEDRLKSEEPVVGLLINSAGMGIKGAVMDKTAEALDNTVRINCICDHAGRHIRDDHRQRQQQSQRPSLKIVQHIPLRIFPYRVGKSDN